MLTCCACGVGFDFDTAGVTINAVSAQPSPKSGRAIPSEDCFPDGTSQKFVCAPCLLEKQDLATMLGFYGTGYDFPSSEEAHASANVYSVPEHYLPWPAGDRP